MRSAPWAFAAFVLLLGALGLVLWQWAARRQLRRATSRHLAERIAAGLVAGAPRAGDVRRGAPAAGLPRDPWASLPMAGAAAGGWPGFPTMDEAARPDGTAALAAATAAAAAAANAPASAFARRLPGWLRAVATPRQLGLAVGAGGAAALAAGAALGPVAMGGVLLLGAAGGGFVVWLRVQKFRRRLVLQLPGFIDAMVRMVRIGNSPQSAFQLATATLKAPLREAMEHAAALARAGVDLDAALDQTADHLRVGELHLLGAILGLGVRYGGRADLLLERVATSLRDNEQAGQELAAMSAETRLSAWILGLLPLGVGATIMAGNPDYIVRMWLDGTGRTMLFGALGLQSLGALLLYRLARLR
ncbi:type II secretion system F family protein [Variovorax sp. PvP013]|uniref:type II secretion system F family protein n=1 Tax=Variovorax sp. PvP013 TaxID=3156435 RepID=UPI003D1D78F4